VLNLGHGLCGREAGKASFDGGVWVIAVVTKFVNFGNVDGLELKIIQVVKLTFHPALVIKTFAGVQW